MKLEDFLSRLKKVKNTGPNRWIACCPAHDDHSPSLTVGLGKSGGAVVHCFANCPVEAVMAAVGMDLSDLMPDELHPGHPIRPQRIPASDVLKAVSFTMMTAAIILHDAAERGSVISEEKEKLLEIAAELHEAVEHATR